MYHGFYENKKNDAPGTWKQWPGDPAMNRKQLLREIEDLARIPGFERIFYHKVKELKENVSRNPGHYFEILETQDHERKSYPVGKIEFELHMFGKSTWIPVLLESDFCAYEFVTDEIIDYILGIETAPGMPHMRSNIPVEEGKKTIDLTFTKHGNDYYSGTVAYKETGKEEPGPDIPAARFGEPVDGTDKVQVLKLLFHYLWENEAFLDRMFSEFRLRWKPLIDSEVITTAK